jgi:hypothetical protein
MTANLPEGSGLPSAPTKPLIVTIRPRKPMKIIPDGEPIIVNFKCHDGRQQMVFLSGVSSVTRK